MWWFGLVFGIPELGVEICRSFVAVLRGSKVRRSAVLVYVNIERTGIEIGWLW